MTLTSNPKAFSSIADSNIVEEIIKIRECFFTPEHINNSKVTAPSKRLERLFPNYPKVKNGIIISKQTGLDKILTECKHFANWIRKIKEC